MKKKRTKRLREQRKTAKTTPEDRQQQFAEHLQELRKRLFFAVVTILIFSTAAYFVQQRLVSFLLKPAHNQHFIYTSPGGGIGFLFQVCTYVGIIASIPVLLYQLLRFIEPVIGEHKRRFIIKMSWFSALLAIMGFCFGYFIGLPAALHFLSNQFTTTQIQPLLTIQEYMSFVMVYLIGSALIFQLPLIVILINRIKPLKPSQLLGFERYVIAGAFIVSMLMAPTVNIIDQLILAGPIIIIYQLAIVVVLFKNRSGKLRKIPKFSEQDQALQATSHDNMAALPIFQPVSLDAPQRSHNDNVATSVSGRSRIRPTQAYKPVKDFDFIWPARQGA